MPQFHQVWRNKFLTIDATSVTEMVALLRSAANDLERMAEAGVSLTGGQQDDYARLTTSNPAVAKRFGMVEEEDDDIPRHDHGGEG